MKTTLLTLNLPNAKKVVCTVAGNGPNICYIVGPGSFYLKKLPEQLAKSFTFVTSDALWVRRKEDPVNENEIKEITAESLLTHDASLIKKIKEHFSCKQIGIMGFSAPGVIALKQVCENPDDIAWVIGTGLGLCELDPTFTKTDKVFKEKDPERFNKYSQALEDYGKILAGEEKAEPLKTANFTVDQGGKRRLTPNSDYLEKTRFLFFKMVYDIKYEADCFDHWNANSIGLVLNQTLREHYFNSIHPTLDTLAILEEIGKKSKVPVLLVNGENDFITPVDAKARAIVDGYKNMKLVVYTNCGHLPYVEMPDIYSSDLASFVEKYSIEKAPSVAVAVNNNLSNVGQQASQYKTHSM